MIKPIIILLLSMFLIFLFMAILAFTIDLVQGDKITKRQCYKKFLSVLEERSLYKYTFPKMSYEQIINFIEIPEINAMGIIMDLAMSRRVRYGKDGVLILYVRKEGYLNPAEMWINNKREREKNGIILFVPKSYNDYKKLCDYFCNKGNKRKEDEITNAQIESLQYLKTKVHKAQDKSTETLKRCQKENDNITERIKSENKTNEYLNYVFGSDTTTEEDIVRAMDLCMKTGHYLNNNESDKLNKKLVKLSYGKIIDEEIENSMRYVKTKSLPTKKE